MQEIVSDFSNEESTEDISTIINKLRTTNLNIKNQNYINVKKVA